MGGQESFLDNRQFLENNCLYFLPVVLQATWPALLVQNVVNHLSTHSKETSDHVSDKSISTKQQQPKKNNKR